MKQKPTYKITIDGEVSTAAGMASLLLVSVASVILEIRCLFLGQVTRVSLSTLLIVLGFLVLAIKLREILTTLAFALISIQASARIILSHFHSSYVLRHLAAVGGTALKIVGLVMAIFAIVKWFRSVIRRTPISKPEEPTP